MSNRSVLPASAEKLARASSAAPSARVPPPNATLPVPSAVVLSASSTPPSTSAPPVKLLTPDSARVPVPALVSLPLPVMSLSKILAALNPPSDASCVMATSDAKAP